MIASEQSAPGEVPAGAPLDARSLARALAAAASVVGHEPSATDALKAAEAQLHRESLGRQWPEVACSVARALALHAYTRPISVDSLVEADLYPALGRLEDGRWVLVERRLRGQLSVTIIGPHSEQRRRLSPKKLAELAGDGPWVSVEPLLSLDSMARPTSSPWRPWSRLRAFMRLERRELWVVVIYAVVIGAMTLATPVAVQAVVNTVAFGAVLQPLVVLSLLLLAGLSFSALLRALEAFVVEVLQRRLFVRVAEDFGRRVPALDPRVHDSTHVPELINRFFDVVTIQKAGASLLLDALSLSLQMLIGLLLLAFYHPLLLAFGAVLMVILALVIWAGRGATGAAALESTAKYATVAWLEDVARLPTVFRSARAAEHASRRTDALCRDYLRARRDHYRILLRQIVGGLGLQVFAMVSLLGVGGWLVIERQLTLGQLVAAELVIGAVANGFSKLGKHLEKVYDVVIGVEKLGRVIDLSPERRGGEAPRGQGPASLALRNASVTRGGRALLKAANLSIAQGEHVLLRGGAASGKSTLLDALMGVGGAVEGAVLFDGIDLRRADLAAVRDQIVCVRSPEWVAGTVSENLCLGLGARSETSLRASLEAVGLAEAINALPKGLDTLMMPSGAPLSQSQVRRLMLARALAARPRVLLLDGALDRLGLPEQQQQNLLDTIFGAEAPWTVVVVSDEPAVAARCLRTVSIVGAGLEEGS